MDIWSWVYERLRTLNDDEPALARQLDLLSTWTCDGQHGRVDAALPALVAQLQDRKEPWLEVYARHWGLQSRILHRHDGRKDALREAVALAERAHRPDAAECPQSICVTQDLCSAYAVLDGRGHAQARLTAAEETLTRVTPKWPCYRCISSEAIGALRDAGRLDEALARTEAVEAELRVEDGGDMGRERSELLLLLGRFDEALAAIDAHDPAGRGSAGELGKRLRQAHLLHRLGRREEAAEKLPTPEGLLDEVELFAEWLTLHAWLVRTESLPLDVELVKQVNTFLRRLSLYCNHRDTLEAAVEWATLAHAEGSWAYADAWCALAERHLPQLAAALGADMQVATCRSRLDADRPEAYGHDAPSVHAAMDVALEAKSLSFGRMVVTAADVPAAVRNTRATAEHWLRLAWPERADQVLEHALALHLDDELVRLRLRALLEAGDLEGLQTHLDRWNDVDDPAVQLQVQWFRSLAAERKGDLDTAIDAIVRVLALRDGDVSPPIGRRHASLLQKAGRYDDALAELNTLIAGEPERDDHWFRMEVATVLERWDLVRASGKALAFDFDGEGFIDEPAGALRLEVTDDTVLWAQRLGPCHARITTITGPGREEHHGEVWAFDPFSGAGENPVFRVNRRLSPTTSVAVTLDGLRMPDDEGQALLDEVREQGGTAYIASGEEYRLKDPDSEEVIDAVWVKVALPAEHPFWPVLHERFSALAERHRPLIWPELLDFLGRRDEADTHRKLGARWGM